MALALPWLPTRSTRLTLLLLSLCFLGACSTQPKQADSQATSEPAKHQTDKALSSPTLTVESSHGIQEIEPTVVGYSELPAQSPAIADTPDDTFHISDPLEVINRPIFAFNDVLYRYLMIPASQGYKAITPELFRTGVSNVFANIREPINGLNHLLQLEGRALGHNLSRFLINSTLGLLGIFDLADNWFGIDSRVTHIEDTLRTYGVGYGSYLVLPFFGQSDFRNGFSIITESFASPIRQVTDNPETLYVQSYLGFHNAVPKLLSYKDLYKDKKDPYVFFRNLYMQSILRDQQFPVSGSRSNKATASKAEPSAPPDSEAQP